MEEPTIMRIIMTRKTEDPKIPKEIVPDSAFERIALGATNSIGSLPSLILHSIFFVGIFSLQWLGFAFEQIMLILTTVVSLEAIYLSIFIQMSVNRQAKQIAEVSEDIEEIQEDTKEISEDVEDIQEDVDHIKEDVEDLGEDFEKSEEGDGREMEKIHQIERVLEELLREIKSIKSK